MADPKYADLSRELSLIDVELAQIEQQLVELKCRKRKLAEKRDQIERTIEHRSAALSIDTDTWEAGEFQWSLKLKTALNEHFNLSAFRPMQLSAINAMMSGEDVILIMSTGGGKSLCYQLPAIASNGVTLVVSPLISLMEDQTLALERLGIDTAMLNASTSKEDLAKIQADMLDAKASLRLLYVTPEKLAKSKRFMAKLEKMYQLDRLKFIAIDEVHCCSQWGNDFRPDYKFLNVLKRQFPKTPILGLTATATCSVIDDVKTMLGVPGALVFRAGFNRPNLYYEVRQKPANNQLLLDDLRNLITGRFCDQSGIVYCFTRKETEELASELRSLGIKAGCYHADLSAEHRSRTHTKWLSNHYQVIVATVAFGMGIDKPDVRFVIHHSLPKSLENYYQESGRAGRDEAPAFCVVYYKFGDIFRQTTMVCTEKTGLENAYSMVAYCHDSAHCRRALIAKHFGESWEPDWCQAMCDNCTKAPSSHQKTDISQESREILMLLRSGQKLTGKAVVDAWFKMLGGKRKAGLSREHIERAVTDLLLEGCIKEDFHFTPYNIISYLSPGAKASVVDQQQSVEMVNSSQGNAKKARLT